MLLNASRRRLSIALVFCGLCFLKGCSLAENKDRKPPFLESAPVTQNGDFSTVPGVVIAHIPANSQKFIGSPSIAKLPSGKYIASHDLFGPKSSKKTTYIYQSLDQGKTWKYLTQIKGQWWSNLFIFKNQLYIMGVDKQHGNVIIRRSNDEGKTWTTPRDQKTGLLLEGTYHTAPVPVVFHNGRIWRTIEDQGGKGEKPWNRYRPLMMSAPIDQDLLVAKNWTVSNAITGDLNWLDGKFEGYLEGNAVVTADGSIINIMRVAINEGEKAALVKLNKDGNIAFFDPKTDFINFPGGAKKFVIRFDPQTNLYWSLSNYIRPEDQGKDGSPKIRNTLALISSEDLRNWKVNSVILHHQNIQKVGFQYADWLFEGNDIILVLRTAYDDGLGGANNAHDANFLTFYRFKNFRKFATQSVSLSLNF